MSTIDRLRELVRGTNSARPTPPRELTYEPVDASGLPLPVPARLPELDGATHVDTPFGPAVAIERVIEGGASHGRVRVEEVSVGAPDVALVAGRAATECDETWPVLFLDLETTGLSGGAGTVAFLVGCGWFREGAFHTRQYLLPAFARERALVHVLTQMTEEVGAIVTYNGRTFDVPVMETRWAFHRVSSPWEELPHLDMLHLARRLWRARPDAGLDGGCRLVSLERDLLGVDRVGDVPGWEIPTRYFAYLRSGDATLLEPVLHHNRLDLLSLAALTSRAARLFREGPDAAADPTEAVTLGRELARRGEAARAEQAFTAAIDRAERPSEARADALHGLARLFRRQRRHREAAAAWHELVAEHGARLAARHEASEALAVHAEHRDRDLDSARRWAMGAAAISAGRPHDRVVHRLVRLERKLAARGSAPLRLPL